MLSTIQAMWLMAWRLTQLCEAGTMTHEQASLVKAWTTLRGREVRAGQDGHLRPDMRAGSAAMGCTSTFRKRRAGRASVYMPAICCLLPCCALRLTTCRAAA